MVKDFLSILRDYGILPIIYGAGIFSLTMFGLSLIPSWSWLPKAFLLFVLTH
jgi:hypothetical protein